jgi:2-oxoglutarate dehydrogenase E2 component (dihydrolipoamide succinyltransferase)
MAQKVLMPQMGESVVQGTVAKWLVKEGDRVKADQPLVEVSTDKIDVEIPSPAEGVISRILVEEGQTVDVGAELAEIDGSGLPDSSRPEERRAEPPPEPPPGGPVRPLPSETPVKGEASKDRADQTAEGERQRISPLVRRLAKEHRIDLSRVRGTGFEGRITKEDILNFVGSAASPPKEKPKEERERPSPSAGLEFTPPRYEPKEGDQVIPFSRVRKLTAEHMVASKRISAHVATVAEVDLTEIVKLRQEKRAPLKEKEGIDLTFLPFVAAAAVGALKEHPLLNASVVDEKVVVKKEINLGVAVETEAGLIVPVVHHADELSLLGMAKAVAELAEKARTKRLTVQEISGGTFTLTNPGKKGNLFGTPIIFQPQVGILRLGEVVKRPAVIQLDGEEAIAIRSMMYLTLSYDHRIIDGVTGNGFLHRVKEFLEAARFAL